jgi:hypothetical protein
MTVLLGAVLIAPHIGWLVHEDFPPMRWVATRRTSADLFDWLRSLSEYSFGTMGYCAVAVLTCLLLVRPPLAAWRDILFPRDAARRMAGLIFWLPLLMPIAVAVITWTNLLSLWNTELLALLPVVLLSCAADDGYPNSRGAHHRLSHHCFGGCARRLADRRRYEVERQG